ncbi:SDR family oxidoreductase [Chloroflexota bacterium]
MNKAVVTGGAGFIGSHLAEALVERGYHVTIVDDLSTGHQENIRHLLEGGAAEFVRGSVEDAGLLGEAFRGAKYVFHLAALPSVPRSIADPVTTHHINASGTLGVLVAARDAGVSKVVYASSSSAYGDTPTLPKQEDMTPHPQSPYAVAKLTGEYYCSVFQKVYGLETASLRFFNVYGPRQNPDSQYAAVIPRFISMLARGEAPTIYGDGEQTRDFTFVLDVVQANIKAAEGDGCGTFNVGTGKRISLNGLTGEMVRLMDSEVTPVHVEARPGDVLHSLADISRAGAFGYLPAYSLEDGLRQTVEYLKKAAS